MTRSLAALLCLCAMPAAAAAQSGDPGFRPRSVFVAAGVASGSGYDIGSRTAELRRNVTGPGTSFPLFAADAEIARATGIEARAGVALTRRLAVEVGGRYATPQMQVQVSRDPEITGGATIREPITRYAIDVSGVWQVPFVRLGSRARPFVIAGGGTHWEFQEDRLQIERGSFVHGGGGLLYWLRGGDGARRALGARADVRAVRRTGGIDLDGAARVSVAVSALGFIVF